MTPTQFSSLAIDTLEDFVFGRAPRPLTLANGLTIGAGTVYPELNFTLPTMEITAATMPTVRQQYTEMITSACQRAVELEAPGLVVEFELLPELTNNPTWGAEITAILRETLDTFAAQKGLRSALRVTPNDVREFERPPIMRTGRYWDNMVQSFDLCAAAGADMLSIESTGGKELHDDAILHGNVPLAVFALGVLGSQDMAFLWDMIVEVAHRHDIVAAGDTACGFGNTAMVLAETRYIPRVWAAMIRVMTVARSLVAFERGAIGPSKDCAYEGPFLKAITGFPISLEGAEAACAHTSPVGNIAKATADLWSNESVQNIKLLGGMAPVVSVEQLIYATRLMNVALGQGTDAARTLQGWLVDSDAHRDPQAFVLRPDAVLTLSRQIVQGQSAYERTRIAARASCDLLREAHQAGALALTGVEQRWLNRLSNQIDELPDSEDALLAEVEPTLDPARVRLDQYGIG